MYNNIFSCRLIACLFSLLTLFFPSLIFADENVDPGQITFRTQISDFGFEHIDPYTGHLTLTYKDVSLPGNGGLDLEIYRTYLNHRGDVNYTVLGSRWDTHFGRLKKNGIHIAIELQDGTLNGAIWQQSTYIYLTKDYWKVNMEGTPSLQLPDGTEIIFGRGGNIDYDYWYYATEIRRNNSVIIIHYGTNRKVDYVTDSTGKQINFHYSGPCLTSITCSQDSGQRELVHYSYSTIGSFFYLQKVTLPDGDNWQYNYSEISGSGWSTFSLVNINTPYGGTVHYDYDIFTRATLGGIIRQISVSKKTVSGHGIPSGKWTYDYGVKYKDPWDNPIHLDYTTIIDSCGRTTTYHFFGYSGGFDSYSEIGCYKYGLLRRKFTTDPNGTLEEAIEYSWDKLNDPISTYSYAVAGVYGFCSDQDTYVPVLIQQIVYHGGTIDSNYQLTQDPDKWKVWNPTNIYVTKFRNFDNYGNARNIRDYDSLPLYEYTPALRTTTKTYWHNEARNIVKDKPATIHVQGIFPGNFQSGYSYDPRGNILTENHYGVTTTHTYHVNGNLASTTDANNNTTWYEWDNGAVSRIENPEYTLTRTINPDGTVADETNGRGYITRYTYTPGMRLKREIPPVGNPTIYSYHFGAGSYTGKTRGTFSSWTYYDGLGRKKGTRDSLGKTTTIAYKACGLKNYTTSNIGDTTYFDNLGRIRQITHKDGKLIRYIHNSDTDILVTDEAGKQTHLIYHTFGAPGEKYLTSVKDADGHTAQYSYNILGNLTSSSFDGITRSFEYNTKNFLIRETHPESGITAYTHDGVGNIKSRDDGLITKIYSYDGINRLTSVSAGSQTLGYQYDNADNLTRLTSPDSTVSYQYDAADRLTWTGSYTLGRNGALAFTWDNNDNLKTIRYPSGRTVGYSYNGFNQVTGISGFGGSVTTIGYFTNAPLIGLLRTFRFGNGQTTTLSYNSRRAMTRTASGALNLGFQYGDYRGNMTRLINYQNQGKNKTFNYDNLNRLTVFKGPWGQNNHFFDYHPNGNRKRKVKGNTISYGYNANRMSSATGTSYAYNGDGDMTRMGSTYLDYTPFHRLWRIRKSGRTLATLGYDGNGNRIYKKTGSNAEIFLRGPDNNILADLDGSGRSKREYIFLNGKLVAKAGSPDRKAIVAPWLILLLGNH